ncbi:hypothetical protein C8J56DRAFT_820430 [Mycena floridula]|nr:hypothetical protein C8J56DRAFT_820430 [Mycena floridula]
MNSRDSPLTSHDHNIIASTGTRSPTRSTTSKRSPSPRILFKASPLSTDKGVQNITRKVIRRLEGLGHLDVVDMSEQDDLEEREEVEETLKSLARDLRTPEPNGTAPMNPVVKKIDWEIPRKTLHSSIGFFTIYLYLSQNSPKTVIYVLWTALAVIAPADVLRLRYPAFERVYERFLGPLMRESEKHTSNGVIWYILGVNVALQCFPLDVATVAILILSWADTAASTIGRLWGSKTRRLPARLPLLRLPLAPRKSLAGFLAATVTGACIAVGFWGWLAPNRSDPSDITWTWENGVAASPGFLGLQGKGLGGLAGWTGLATIGIVAGLVSGVAEALDLGSWDDNLTLPIIAGACLFSFFKLVGVLSG